MNFEHCCKQRNNIFNQLFKTFKYQIETYPNIGNTYPNAKKIVNTRDAHSATSTLFSLMCCFNASNPRGLSSFELLSAIFLRNKVYYLERFLFWAEKGKKKRNKCIEREWVFI